MKSKIILMLIAVASTTSPMDHLPDILKKLCFNNSRIDTGKACWRLNALWYCHNKKRTNGTLTSTEYAFCTSIYHRTFKLAYYSGNIDTGKCTYRRVRAQELIENDIWHVMKDHDISAILEQSKKAKEIYQDIKST